MKILQFAFDDNPDNDHRPSNYKEDCVVYTGTHDNHTVLGWWCTNPNEDQKSFALEYTGSYNPSDLPWELYKMRT